MCITRRAFLCLLVFLGLLPPVPASGAVPGGEIRTFFEQNCLDCHDRDSKKAGLDLTLLDFDGGIGQPTSPWVKIHDRVAAGEMPPKTKPQPAPADRARFVRELAGAITMKERQKTASEGRSVRRRLNRLEYEATLRDLLSLPSLDVKSFLPEDPQAHGFTKTGEALDVSHVQMARYLSAADFALREAMAPHAMAPTTSTRRFHAMDDPGFFGLITLEGPRERRTFPLVDLDLQRDLMAMKPPRHDAATNAAQLNREAMAVVVSTYEPTEIRFSRFRAPVSGNYRLRMSARSIWMDAGFTRVTAGHRWEPVTLSADRAPRTLRKLGGFDVGPDPTVGELVVWLEAGETIRPDAVRLFRSRPPDHKNPLTTPEGMPGVAFQWLEVDGPLFESWPPPGHRLLFGDLPLVDRPVVEGIGRQSVTRGIEVQPRDAARDADRLLKGFMDRALRRPVVPLEQARFRKVIESALASGHSFSDAMLAGYTAVLCSPAFLYLDEEPGRLGDRALADRLAFFLWNSAPDARLRDLASRRQLGKTAVLRAETERMLNDQRSHRFVEAFLDHWLELRGITGTAPDAELYPDYQLDDLLVDSMVEETRAFFAELIGKNLGATNLVTSDFSMVNERLAVHYGIKGVEGIRIQRVALPPGDVRGGLWTQASVLKVTANGTTTSPVKRGAWIMAHLMGEPPPPPPPAIPAVEPDIRGAVTLRDQLARHRNQESCNTCHRLIDPAGFALESFDVMGAWRDRYRVTAGDPVKGIGHNGILYHFGLGLPVDPSGELPDGSRFADVKELRALLLRKPEKLVRNLARQFIVYATGTPVRFSDRDALEKVVERTSRTGGGVRTLIHEVVQSDLFRYK